MLYELILINEIEQRAKIIFLSVYKLYIQYSVSELLGSVQQDEGEQRTAENSTLWVTLLTLLHRFPEQHDTPSTNAPIIETTTNRCRDTAFYSYWLALEFPWWKDRGLSQSGHWYTWSVSNA